MLVDMHCHYPTHLVAEAPKRGSNRTTAVAAGALRESAGRPEWRVSLDKLIEGDVRGVYSVLYEPFAEFDLDEPYGAPPEDSYFVNPDPDTPAQTPVLLRRHIDAIRKTLGAATNDHVDNALRVARWALG